MYSKAINNAALVKSLKEMRWRYGGNDVFAVFPKVEQGTSSRIVKIQKESSYHSWALGFRG